METEHTRNDRSTNQEHCDNSFSHGIEATFSPPHLASEHNTDLKTYHIASLVNAFNQYSADGDLRQLAKTFADTLAESGLTVLTHAEIEETITACNTECIAALQAYQSTEGTSIEDVKVSRSQHTAELLAQINEVLLVPAEIRLCASEAVDERSGQPTHSGAILMNRIPLSVNNTSVSVDLYRELPGPFLSSGYDPRFQRVSIYFNSVIAIADYQYLSTWMSDEELDIEIAGLDELRQWSRSETVSFARATQDSFSDLEELRVMAVRICYLEEATHAFDWSVHFGHEHGGAWYKVARERMVKPDSLISTLMNKLTEDQSPMTLARTLFELSAQLSVLSHPQNAKYALRNLHGHVVAGLHAQHSPSCDARPRLSTDHFGGAVLATALMVEAANFISVAEIVEAFDGSRAKIPPQLRGENTSSEDFGLPSEYLRRCLGHLYLFAKLDPDTIAGLARVVYDENFTAPCKLEVPDFSIW